MSDFRGQQRWGRHLPPEGQGAGRNRRPGRRAISARLDYADAYRRAIELTADPGVAEYLL